MRITKEHEERKSEILDKAETLFYTKGYTKTTINDILHNVGIAKGTFYYYFKSKEEVMHAIVDRIVEYDMVIAVGIMHDTSLTVFDKLLKIMLSQGQESRDRSNKKELVEQFHQPGNEIIHQYTLAAIIKKLSPILADVTQQGIKEGLFHVNKVQETIELLFAGAEFIFDIGAFNWTSQEKKDRVIAFLELMELALGANTGSFTYLSEIFTN